MGIGIDQYRCSIGLFCRAKFVTLTIRIIPPLLHNVLMSGFANIAYLFVIHAIILLISSDIEINPGPDSVKISRQLSICHLNIQSIKRNSEKLDHISVQLCTQFDIITVSETWLTADEINQNYNLKNYHPIHRRDRGIGRGGGVAAWVSVRLVSKRREDLERPDIEAL